MKRIQYYNRLKNPITKWIYPFVMALIILVPLTLCGQSRANRIQNMEAMLQKTENLKYLRLKPDIKLRAMDLFTRHKALFKLGAEDQMVNIRTDISSDNIFVYRFQQYYKSLPVEFAQLIIHEEKGVVTNLIGDWVPGLSLSITPVISETAALQHAISQCPASVYIWDLSVEDANKILFPLPPKDNHFPHGELCIVNDNTGLTGTFHLAYKFEIYALDPMTKETIYIDATDGHCINQISLITTTVDPVQSIANTLYDGARPISTGYVYNIANEDPYFVLEDHERGGGIATQDLQGSDNPAATIVLKNTSNTWDFLGNPLKTGPSIHWGLSKSFDYFNNRFNLSSYNGANMLIIGLAHWKVKHRNAKFNGSVFFFGDGDGFIYGPFVSLDVIAHEYTHAVTQYSAGLIYQAESGAINEGFSDLFGYTIKDWVKGGNWGIGEDISMIGRPFRSLMNPLSTGQPDTYQGYQWFSTADISLAKDYGGVHRNCGVFNKWFYLFTVGGKGTNTKLPPPGDDYSVEGVGMNQSVTLAYKLLTNYLNPNATFEDTRAASITAAISLTGDDCSKLVQQCKNAWFAVGVGHHALMLLDSIVDHPDCNGDNGMITLLVETEDPDEYPIYTWSNGGTNYWIQDLSPGIYTVTITDPTSNCTIEASFTLEEKDPFNIKIQKTDETFCHANDGWAAVYITTPLNQTPEYHWSNGENTHIIKDLIPISYTVTVTDTESNCSVTETISIKPFVPMVTIIPKSGTYTRCANDGFEIEAYCKVSRCNGCSFLWDTGDTLQATKFGEGFHWVVIADSAGCTAMDTTRISIEYKNCSGDEDNSWNIHIWAPADPNDISGPLGYGNEQFMAKQAPLSYMVRFENDPKVATAPASKVIVEVPMNDKTSLYSLRLGNFGFGSFHFSPPPNSTFYTTRLDVRDSLGVFVDLIAGINVESKKAFWIFQAIDPITGVEPLDPSIGFLPVNDTNTHIGEGYVSFTWKAASQAMTGDILSAQASIVFDINEAIATNTWTNTIDALPPASNVAAFSSSTDSLTFHLAITGSDDPGGSGIQLNSLYVSTNLGPFLKNSTHLPGAPVTFSGATGNAYRFFSLATDNTGQREPMKIAAEAQVTVIPDLPMISGLLTYDNQAHTPLSQVDLKLKNNLGMVRDSTITDAFGGYVLFPPVNGAYRISGNSTKTWGGVNAADALLVLRHFVEMDTLSGLRLRAADVNLSNTVNSADALLIAKRYVELTNSFLAGDWLFDTNTMVINNQNIEYNFHGICTGDIDGSYIPPNLKPAPTVDLIYPETLDVRVGEPFDLPIRIGRDEEIGAISLVLHYQDDILEILDVLSTSPHGSLVYTASQGILRMAWYSIKPMMAEKNDILFYIRIKAKELPATFITLFTHRGESSLANGKAHTLTGVNLLIPKVRIDVPFAFRFLQNQPNPFNTHTNISFSLPERALVTLQITDMLGQEVMTLVNGDREKGSYTISVDGNTLPGGTYIAVLKARGDTRYFSEAVKLVKIAQYPR